MAIAAELQKLMFKEPFEPFRIKLVNGDQFDVADPMTLAFQGTSVWMGFRDGHWLVFPLDKVNSFESLVADFPGEFAMHGGQ